MIMMKAASIIEQRGKYLWSMANLCHIDAIRLDELRVLDFYQYMANIDQYNEAARKRNRE